MTSNLDEVLADGYKRSVALKDNDFQSHSDRLRIGQPDEFDVDIVIRLPASDLFIEKYSPGFVRLRTGSEFSGMCSNDDHNIKQHERLINFAKHHSILTQKTFHLSIRDRDYAHAHREGRAQLPMSVDLVPALEFTEDKWPHDDRCYRQIPAHCRVGSWLVVPKGTSGSSPQDPQRIWRVSLHAQEKRLIHGTRHLRQAIRLTKKVRDTLELNEIASYYIKTLFLWEFKKRKCEFWSKRVGFIFNIMVRKLYEAVCVRKIPFFWNPRHNLIGHVHPQLLHNYELRLKNLVDTLEEAETRPREVAKFF
ncbi:hypothetical protein EVAR_40099_1 [Eumeta japonica]|uniref:Uncharacterized protein n=1 Tax=Eumeta variegata TaxID=151549 RepID=A0A4C1W935_EUMVA|nr:hypothetical protein EVAR_40099_1 [Eumeta japonica]